MKKPVRVTKARGESACPACGNWIRNQNLITDKTGRWTCMNCATAVTTCRYLEDNGKRCTQPALHADNIDICARHAALITIAIRQQATSKAIQETA